MDAAKRRIQKKVRYSRHWIDNLATVFSVCPRTVKMEEK